MNLRGAGKGTLRLFALVAQIEIKIPYNMTSPINQIGYKFSGN